MWLVTRLIRHHFFPVSYSVLLLTVLLQPVMAQGEEKEPSLSAELRQLIHEVKQNEDLYQNLQLKLNTTEIDHAELIEYEGPKPIKRQSTLSFIRQGEKFRQQIDTKGRFVLTFTLGLYWLQDGYRAADPAEIHENETWIQVETGSKESTSVFDGTTYRSFWSENFKTEGSEEPPHIQKRGLISDRPSRLSNQTSPHRFLFEPAYLPASLSRFLTGKEAVQAETGKPAANTRVTETGTETFQELKCTTLRMETLDSAGKARSRTDLWLAQDRNMIPVRKQYFIYHVSKKLPISESLIETWQEVSPGIWFPKQAHTNHYYARLGKLEPGQKPSKRIEYTLKSIELDPQLPADIFTKLVFEAGTPVTVISDGRRIKRF
ncbi:hypothetical protein [Gimesia sp.]|uniref:hypothetical protein n=1 Tax=Gimesia sp. TaxID=2024833 RepID=UPI003A8F5099